MQQTTSKVLVYLLQLTGKQTVSSDDVLHCCTTACRQEKCILYDSQQAVATGFPVCSSSIHV